MEELPTSRLVGAASARELLADVAVLRQRARRPAVLWPPLVIFGAVTAVGAPLGVISSLAANLWWLAAAPVGFVLVGWCSARQARRHGFEGSTGRRLTALGIASFGACWVACFGMAVALHLPIGLGWSLAVAAGYLAWSRFARSGPAALVAVSLAITGTVLVLSPAPSWTVQFGVGIVMITGGLLLRRGPEAPSARRDETPSARHEPETA